MWYVNKKKKAAPKFAYHSTVSQAPAQYVNPSVTQYVNPPTAQYVNPPTTQYVQRMPSPQYPAVRELSGNSIPAVGAHEMDVNQRTELDTNNRR
jgi:hypothetical protein